MNAFSGWQVCPSERIQAADGLDLGADGIVTDHIDVLRDVLADRGHPLVPPG